MIDDKSAFNRFVRAFLLQLKAQHNFDLKITKARELLSRAVGAKNHNQFLAQLPRSLEDWLESEALDRLSSDLREKHGFTLDERGQFMDSVIEEFNSMPNDLTKLSAKADQNTYAIVSSYSGYPDVVLAKGIEVAVLSFLQTAFMTADLFPDEDISFVGQDQDDGLPILAMMIDADVMVTLQRPFVSDGRTVVHRKLVSTAPTHLPGLDASMPPQDIAERVDLTYKSIAPDIKPLRQAGMMNSMAAHRLSHDFTTILLESAEESLRSRANNRIDTGSLLKAIDSIRLTCTTTATVR